MTLSIHFTPPTWSIDYAGWPGFALGGLRPSLRCDGRLTPPSTPRSTPPQPSPSLKAAMEREQPPPQAVICTAPHSPHAAMEREQTPSHSPLPTHHSPLTNHHSPLPTAEWVFDSDLQLRLSFQLEESRLWLRAVLQNCSSQPVCLNEVRLLEAVGQLEDGTAAVSFGAAAEQVRILEQGNYWGQVSELARPGAALKAAAVAEAGAAAEAAPGTKGVNQSSGGAEVERNSDFFSVVYDRSCRMAFLAGFLTSERWIGRIHFSHDPAGRIQNWWIGFDGGDLTISPGQALELETVLLAFGPDPWALLEQYADEAARGSFPPLTAPESPRFHLPPPVSWCSWYPYRLSVSEDRVLANARLAAQRLKPLGLSIIELDLGWEKDHLPSAFEENERFAHGLPWLAEELGRLGFQLGAWKAPYTISEFDPLCRQHPEWLIQDADGQPFAYWEWYWEPHGKVYILDLTHPGSRAWLDEKVAGLFERGVRYLKADFIGCVSDSRARRRYDQSIVAGGGCEAARLGAEVIRGAAERAAGEGNEVLLLNCGGPEMPGRGSWPLLYTCNDTGNTGFISSEAQQTNFQAVACHLFKNWRWGILQPSCLCVGLPGALEEARLRATVAFLTGGQVDLGDDLTSLPEDRWAVLTASLPPLGVAARPIDLFDPIYDGSPYDYQTDTQGGRQQPAALQEYSPGSLWLAHIVADWDEWDLLAIFNMTGNTSRLSRFTIPLERLGIPPGETRLAYEFWSGQFLGLIPGGRRNVNNYHHPGDFQDLKTGSAPDIFELAFFAPSVKLLCLRRPRPHPWVVGTRFHQSCGAELHLVMWDEPAAALRGVIRRPAGESGALVIDCQSRPVLQVEVDGRPAGFQPGAQGSVIIPLVIPQPKHTPQCAAPTEHTWTITFA